LLEMPAECRLRHSAETLDPEKRHPALSLPYYAAGAAFVPEIFAATQNDDVA
jgi:hypothetical protein